MLFKFLINDAMHTVRDFVSPRQDVPQEPFLPPLLHLLAEFSPKRHLSPAH